MDQNPYIGQFLNLINYCNTQIENTNDYQIAKIILENISTKKDLSLENIASKACISQSSVSRFMKKAGFANYQQFRDVGNLALLDVSLNRKMYNLMRFSNNEEKMVEDLFEHAILNLKATKEKISLTKLKSIVEIMRKGNSVSFFGDDHALSNFYTVQLDLIANNQTTYLFKNEQVQQAHANSLKKGDVVIFLNVSKQFITPSQKEIIKEMNQRGVTLLLIAQDIEKEMEQYFNEIYFYGCEGSMNEGFYSLYFISTVLSEFVYMNK